MKFSTKQCLLVPLVATLLLLSGCGYFDAKAEKAQTSSREQQCSDLKSTLTTTRPYETNGHNPTRESDAMRSYDKYGCSQFEKNK